MKGWTQLRTKCSPARARVRTHAYTRASTHARTRTNIFLSHWNFKAVFDYVDVNQ